jgi:hypothetical protein
MPKYSRKVLGMGLRTSGLRTIGLKTILWDKANHIEHMANDVKQQIMDDSLEMYGIYVI